MVEKPVVAELVLSYPGRKLENVPHSKNTSTHSNVFTVKVDTPGAAQQNCLHAQQKSFNLERVIQGWAAALEQLILLGTHEDLCFGNVF